MKCCVPNCTKSRVMVIENPNSYRITFHTFPKDPKQRAEWIKSIGIPNWIPFKNNVVCSDHFKDQDLLDRHSGTRRLKAGAVPIVDNSSLPVAMRVCKICLCLDAKMYHITEHSLDEMYQNVLGISPRLDDGSPQNICWECAARLNAAEKFRVKALLADALLVGRSLTTSDIFIMRQQHTSLKSTLSIQKVYTTKNVDDEKLDVKDIPHNYEDEVDVTELVKDVVMFRDESNIKLVEENTNMDQNDVKTEVDLVPTIDIGEQLIDLDIAPEDVGNFIDDVTNIDSDDDKHDTNKPKAKTEEDIEDGLVLESITSKAQDDVDASSVIAKDLKKPIVRWLKKKTPKAKNENKRGKRRRREVVGDVVDNGRVIKKRKKNGVETILAEKNMFNITQLKQEDLIQELQKRKDTDRYKNAPYKCTVCYVGFHTKEVYTRHLVKHSEQCGPFECPICKFRMKLSRILRAHMKSVHSTEYSCKLCPLVTRSKTVALGHVQYHDGRTYECPQCLLKFDKHTTLLSHKRLKHVSDCVCELCGHTFISQKGVRAHKAVSHRFGEKNAALEGPYCQVCDVKFLSQKAYDKHTGLSSKHIKGDNDPNRLSNDPAVKVPQIGPVRTDVIRRTRIRKRDETTLSYSTRPVTCEQCGLVLRNYRNYMSHFKSAHPGMNQSQRFTSEYMCEYCGKIFINRMLIECHMWVHTGEKRFECDHCHKCFSMKGALANHMQQHMETGPRPDPCRICGKILRFSYNLKRHMFAHTGLKPFQCNACDKNFAAVEQLRAHTNHVHLKKPRPKRVRRRTKKCDK